MKKLDRRSLQARSTALAIALTFCLTPCRSPAQDGTGLGKLASALSEEPVIVDPSRAYATVATPPGSVFRPVSLTANSLIEQLAHSSDGIVRLPPGDYSIPVRLY